MTDKVLIVGATGSFGGALLTELLDRGIPCRALLRNPAGLSIRPGLEIVAGDATSHADLTRAADGCGAIVWGFNVSYEHWHKEVEPATEVLCRVAATQGLTVLFPGNVYALPAGSSRPLDESVPAAPPTAKGELRMRVEARLAAASEQGAQVIVLRCGDFFGHHGRSAWLDQIAGKAASKGVLRYPGPWNVRHAWAFLPDVAAAGAELLARREQLARFEAFHFAGHALTGHELAETIERIMNRPLRRRGFPWSAIRAVGLVLPLLRELHAMRYLWLEPLELDDSKLVSVIGRVPTTPLEQALKQAL